MDEHTPLRRGWTTGACATAAAKAAFIALKTGEFPDPVDISLPGGKRPAFALAQARIEGDSAFAAIVKDAGDDPDVTHGALVCARVRRGAPGSGIMFKAGEGVGRVTRPGLALAVGEPAINPAPRAMMRQAIAEVEAGADVEIEISIPGGALLAERTLNGRLGIVGGLSILGTTGVVIPFSCSAWIHSIHRGIDVARASGIAHIAGATGNASEKAVQVLYGLPEEALIDMGDFVGGMLKYVRAHPVARVTVAGGFAKMTKLAQGLLDLHSKRGSVDMAFLASLAPEALREEILHANTAAHVLEIARAEGVNITEQVAQLAWNTAAEVLAGTAITLDIAVFDREGVLLARYER